MKSRVCELCNGEALVYCMPDSAYLCWECDARVHGANFLVARHVRLIVCSSCGEFDGNRFSGVGSRPIRSLCQSCVPENDDSVSSPSSSDCSSSSSSTCLSSAGSFISKNKKIASRDRISVAGKITRSNSVSDISVEECLKNRKPTLSSRIKAKCVGKTNVDVNAESILVNWNRKLGLKSSGTLPLALHAFSICQRNFTVLPFRVCLASSLWLAASLRETRGPSTCQLKKLEQCSRVPAKLILIAVSKLSRILKMKKSQQEEAEGWAECSD